MLTAWTENVVDHTAHGGESFREMAQRAKAAFRDMLKTDDNPVVVVTHSGVIRALVAGLENAFRFEVDFASVSNIYYYPSSGFFKLKYLNHSY